MSKKKLIGKVMSDKMDKTVVVEVLGIKKHPKYKKQSSVSKHYKAHDENNEYHIGDQIEIEETRPRSRQKRWIVLRKLK